VVERRGSDSRAGTVVVYDAACDASAHNNNNYYYKYSNNYNYYYTRNILHFEAEMLPQLDFLL